MALDAALNVFRAIGEETRLRIMVLLIRGELTVSEITAILGQSQPRVSRHLKVLTAAGLLARVPEGSWVFHRLAQDGAQTDLAARLVDLAPLDDETLAQDRRRVTVTGSGELVVGVYAGDSRVGEIRAEAVEEVTSAWATDKPTPRIRASSVQRDLEQAMAREVRSKVEMGDPLVDDRVALEAQVVVGAQVHAPLGAAANGEPDRRPRQSQQHDDDHPSPDPAHSVHGREATLVWPHRQTRRPCATSAAHLTHLSHFGHAVTHLVWVKNRTHGRFLPGGMRVA